MRSGFALCSWLLLIASVGQIVGCGDESLPVAATEHGGANAASGGLGGDAGAAGGLAGATDSETGGVAGTAAGGDPGASSGSGGGGGAISSGSGGVGSGGAGSSAGEAGAGGMASSAGASGGGGAPAVVPACDHAPANGACVDASTLRFCQASHGSGDTALPAQQVTVPCGSGFVCVEGPSDAACVRPTVCTPGDEACGTKGYDAAICSPSGTGYELASCPGGAPCRYTVTGLPLGGRCEPSSPAKHTLSGCVTYERRALTPMGLASPTVDPASYLTISVADTPPGESEPVTLGTAVAGEDGCFRVDLTAAPTAAMVVHASALAFAPGALLLGVAHNPDGTKLVKKADDYWHWSNADAGCDFAATVVLDESGLGQHVLGGADHDAAVRPGPDWLIPEKCGSGAVHAFVHARRAMARVHADHLDLGTLPGEVARTTDGLPVLPLVVFWEPGVDVPCGTCMDGKDGGPYHVAPSGLVDDAYDAAMWISGSEANGQHWSASVISHEMGHWAMHSYSRVPGEGGPHYATGLTKPALAYHEGWASAFGQWNESRPSAGNWNGLYLDRQGATTYFVDLTKLTWNGGALPSPDPTAGPDAPLNEFVIASAIFRLAAPPSVAPSSQGLGAEALLRTLASPRLKGSLGRGYFRTDFVDFLDAGRCSGALPESAIEAVAAFHQYPWDQQPLCQ